MIPSLADYFAHLTVLACLFVSWFLYASVISVAAICDIGSASFKYDMRRLLEILALPKAWYRRSLARRMFLGEELTTADSDSLTGINTTRYVRLLPTHRILSHFGSDGITSSQNGRLGMIDLLTYLLILSLNP